MNIRIGVSGLFALALGSFGAAAWGGPPQLAALQAQDAAAVVDTTTPAWVLALPAGTAPRDNTQTTTAFIALSQARTATNEGRRQSGYQSGLTAAQAGIAADPTNPQSYLQAGEAHLGLGDFASAHQMFARATELYPRYVLEVEYFLDEAWVSAFNEGVAALQEDDEEEAMVAFAKANAIFPGRPEGFVELAALILAEEDDDRIPELLELYGSALDAIFARRDRGDVDAAATFEGWKKYMEISLYNRAHFLFSTGRHADAVDAYVLIAEHFPEDNAIVAPAVVAVVQAGEIQEQLPLLEGFLARQGLSPEDYMQLGGAFYGAQRWDQAAEAFRRLSEAFPQDRNALSNHALTLYMGNKAADLVPVAQRLLAMEPYDQTAYRFLINAHLQLQQDTEANGLATRMEALPYEFAGVNFVPTPTGGVFVGQLTNKTAAPGTPVRIRIHLSAPDGSVTATDPVSVNLPAPGAPVAVELPVPASGQFVGYRYEVLP